MKNPIKMFAGIAAALGNQLAGTTKDEPRVGPVGKVDLCTGEPKGKSKTNAQFKLNKKLRNRRKNKNARNARQKNRHLKGERRLTPKQACARLDCHIAAHG